MGEEEDMTQLTSTAKCCHLLVICIAAAKGARPILMMIRNDASFSPLCAHLGQLCADFVVVLHTSGVETNGAAGIHFAERHLFRRWAMI